MDDDQLKSQVSDLSELQPSQGFEKRLFGAIEHKLRTRSHRFRTIRITVAVSWVAFMVILALSSTSSLVRASQQSGLSDFVSVALHDLSLGSVFDLWSAIMLSVPLKEYTLFLLNGALLLMGIVWMFRVLSYGSGAFFRGTVEYRQTR